MWYESKSAVQRYVSAGFFEQRPDVSTPCTVESAPCTVEAGQAEIWSRYAYPGYPTSFWSEAWIWTHADLVALMVQISQLMGPVVVRWVAVEGAVELGPGSG